MAIYFASYGVTMFKRASCVATAATMPPVNHAFPDPYGANAGDYIC